MLALRPTDIVEVLALTDLAGAIWVYIRRDETIRMEVRSIHDGLQLVTHGPRERQRAYDFADPLLLVQHQAAYEDHLLALGYSLGAFTSARTQPFADQAHLHTANRNLRHH